jgi:hypothetical protein
VADVFLSYAREDRAKAEQIAIALGTAGYAVFWDVEIPPGTSWADYLAEKLTNSRAAIVLWSQTSTASQWVREEARLARDRGKLIPVMIDDAAPPFGFGEIQAANLAGWSGQIDHPQWRLLLEGVQRAVGAAPQSSAAPGAAVGPGGAGAKTTAIHATRPAAPNSSTALAPPRNLLVAGGLAIIAAVAVGAFLFGRGGVAPSRPATEASAGSTATSSQGPLAPDMAAVVEKARAAQTAAKAAAEQANRNAQGGQAAAAAAARGDTRYGASQGPMGAVAGDLATLQQGGAAPVGLAMATGAHFFGLMQTSALDGGSLALDGVVNLKGGGWAAGHSEIRGSQAAFVGSGFIPDRYSVDTQEAGPVDSSNTIGIGVLRYANGEYFEGQFRSVGQGMQAQYFRNGLGVHYGANQQIINAGRFDNDAFVGPH